MQDTEKTLRIPQQARSQKTKARLLEAGATLILKKGIHRTSSNEIAKEAGVAVGSFYAYFKDKQSLFLELINNFKDRIFYSVETDQSFVEGIREDPKGTLVQIITSLVRTHKEAREFHDQIMSVTMHDPAVKQMVDGQHQQAVVRTREFLTLIQDQIQVKNFEAAVLVVYITIMENVHLIDKHPAGIAEDDLINEVADLLYRYLFLSE